MREGLARGSELRRMILRGRAARAAPAAPLTGSSTVTGERLHADAERLSHGGLPELAAFPVGAHILSPESLTARGAGRGRLTTLENAREHVENIGR